MTWVAIIAAASLALVFWPRIQNAKAGREKVSGTYARRFIYVNDDGTARELAPDEIEYLNMTFDLFDGARPYIKRRYRQLTPDGKISGYLPRRKLPRKTRVISN
jgi:hypothetical protein